METFLESRYIASVIKLFSSLFGNSFDSAKLVSATMFPEVGKH